MSMTRIREKWDSLFCLGLNFEWYQDVMVFCVFIFLFACLFRTNGEKENLDEYDFRHSYVHFFESAVLKVTYLQLCSEFRLKYYKAH